MDLKDGWKNECSIKKKKKKKSGSDDEKLHRVCICIHKVIKFRLSLSDYKFIREAVHLIE